MSKSSNVSAAIRWQLLSTVSAFALLASAYTSSGAHAAGNDADRPLIWIDLGGQAENVSGQGQVFAPPFLAANSDSPVLGPVTPLQAQKPAKFSFGEDGKISFQPEGSDWMFSAAIRYGRSSSTRRVQHQTDNTFYKYLYPTQPSHNHGLDTKVDFADTQARRSESHAILDFTAGKDIGLGLLGSGSSSTINVGVRIAQFTSSASFDIRARPDLQIKYTAFPQYHAAFNLPYFHTYHATGHTSRSFRGIGPSVSWNGSAPFAGNPQDGELTFDWGANAALLFGKQKARVQHHESAHYYPKLHGFYDSPYPLVYNHPSAGHPTAGHTTDRSVTVPNVGGSVGLSWRAENFKVSFGYRADFFFGAIDGGIDARKSETMGFKGPFASISVGFP
jgi:iron complex outermembrane recepter protein